MVNYRSGKSKREFRVYKEKDPKKVPHVVVPSIVNNREYYICYGAVNWDNTGDYRNAVYIIPHRWGDNGWDKFGIGDNPHILSEDLEAVLKGVDELKNKYIYTAH
jgi:hypothetical protein